MLKKFIATILMMCVLITSFNCVYAENTLSFVARYDSETTILQIEGSGSGNIVVWVVPEAVSPEALSDGNPPVVLDKIYANGNFTYECQLPKEAPGGGYKVYLTTASTTLSDSFRYFILEEANEVINSDGGINDALSGNNYTSFKSLLKQNADKLGIDANDELFVNKSDDIIKLMYDTTDTFADANDLYNKYILACAVVGMKGADRTKVEAILTKHENILGIDVDADYHGDNKLTDSAKTTLCSILGDPSVADSLANGESFNGIFNKLKAVATVKVAEKWQDINKAMEDTFKDVYKFVFEQNSDFNKITSPVTVYSKMMSGINDVKTLKDVQNKFDAAVKASISQNKPTSGNSGNTVSIPMGKVEPIVPVLPQIQVSPFSDVSSDFWGCNAIVNMNSRKAINGYEDGTFRPDNQITRAEFTKLVVSLMPEEKKDTPKETLKVAAVGDSLTQGAIGDSGSLENACSYTYSLQDFLGSGYEVQNFGRAAHGIYEKHEYPYLSTAEYKNSLSFRPDIVISMFGTNDCKSLYWNDIKADYKEIYKDFINSYKEVNPDAKIIICLPTPIFEADNVFKKDRPDPNPQEMREEVKKAAEELGAIVVDAFTPFENRGSDFPDGLHYNKKGASDFAKLVSDAVLGRNDKISIEFDDVNGDDWYLPYVEKAVSNNIIKGSDNKFMPNNNITREDAAVIIYRLVSSRLSSKKASFSDDYLVSDYAKDAVASLAGHLVINGMGDGNFNPKGTLTRAEAAQLLFNAIDYIR